MPSAEHYLAEQASSFTEHSSTDVVKAMLGRGHDGRLLASVVLPPYQDFEALCALNTACYESFSRRPGVRPGAAPAAEPMSLFRSQVVPKMSLMQLGVAMQRNTDCTDEQLLAAIVLCVRYCRRVNFDPTMHTMHRMFVTALHLIQKTTCDVYFQNAAYARLSGMALWEINRLEQEMISGLDWRVMVTITDIVEMLRCNKAYFADLEVTAIPSLGDSDASSADEADGHTRVTCATRRQRESAATFNEAVAH